MAGALASRGMRGVLPTRGPERMAAAIGKTSDINIIGHEIGWEIDT